MSEVRAVIFDIDGTLIDSVDLHARAWVEALAAFGHQVDLDAVRGQIGKGGDKLLPVFLSHEEVDADGQAIEQRRSELMKERYIRQIRPFPGVRELFRQLLADGKQVALASSAKANELQIYKKIAGIDDLPLSETSSDDAEESKPAPDIFEAALTRLDSTRSADVIAIGDTPYDAEAAGKAGLRTIGVLCGGWPAEKLEQAGCIRVYRDPADLLANFRTSPLA